MEETLLKFKLGMIVMTRNASDRLNLEDVYHWLNRHAHGHWGDCSAEAVAENELALREGYRLLSVYQDSNGEKFWIITEADRSTTVLMPEDY